ETPEERLEHAPRPRRRERPERSKASEPREAKPAEDDTTAEVGSDKPDSSEAASGKSVKLFVNRGERSGISEEDLRWALREGAVLPEEAIRDVHVLHRFSFVHVAPDVAE